MAIDVCKDWPVYVLLGGVVFFFVYVIVNGHMNERNSKKQQDKEKK